MKRTVRPALRPTMPISASEQLIVLDIGGEGRHASAWNVNPNPLKTVGRKRGQPIPRWICGRADQIPLPSGIVGWLIVERTPLSKRALLELLRVVSPTGRITLRHVPLPWKDRHALAREILPGEVCRRMITISGTVLQETDFRLQVCRQPRQRRADDRNAGD